MSFRNLTQGNTIYLLITAPTMEYYEAMISQISPSTPTPSLMQNYNFAPINIKARSGEQEFEFNNIDSNHSYAEVLLDKNVPSKGKMIISCSKDDIINFLKKQSNEAKLQISKIDEYKSLSAQSDDILSKISQNPTEVTDIRFNQLESKVDDYGIKMDQILTLLQPKKEEEIK